MKEVMQKAQELAEAILNSEIYQDMKKQENAVQQDAEAAGLLGDLIEKRQRVENVLSGTKMNPDELAEASREMEEAEKRMNENIMIMSLKPSGILVFFIIMVLVIYYCVFLQKMILLHTC